jgi:deoxyribonuclease-4
MVRAADRAAAIGASALQVFSDNPTSWRRRPTFPSELPAFRDRLATHDLAPLAIHAPYLANLASPEPEIHEQSVAVLANELRVAAAYGARFVNVHTGSHRGAGVEVGIARLADGIRQLLERAPAGRKADTEAADGGTVLVLENSAGGGFSLGVTLEELERIDGALAAAGVDRSRIGYCLDTAHAWGAGYAIDTPEGVDETLAEFDRRLGLDRLRMIHLNDSRSALGSRADRHEHIGAGRIGGAGLGRFLVHPGLDHVAYYLETPGMEAGFDEINIRRVQDLALGRALSPLPAEAFETHASRGRSAPPEVEGDAPAAVTRAITTPRGRSGR